MNKNKIFLTFSSTLLLFLLPILLSLYYVVTRYSENFVAEQQLTYFDVQNNWLGQVFLDQRWLDWFNRFMDFAFWGVLGMITLLGLWLFSAAKVSIKNHYEEENFRNFNIPKDTWHSHFIVVVIVKIVVAIMALISSFSLIAQALPLLETNIIIILQQGFTMSRLWQAMVAGLFIVFLQYLFFVSVKIFKLVHGDD